MHTNQLAAATKPLRKCLSLVRCIDALIHSPHIDAGTRVLVAMGAQRERLKLARRRVLDVLNSTRLGDSLLRRADRRQRRCVGCEWLQHPIFEPLMDCAVTQRCMLIVHGDGIAFRPVHIRSLASTRKLSVKCKLAQAPWERRFSRVKALRKDPRPDGGTTRVYGACLSKVDLNALKCSLCARAVLHVLLLHAVVAHSSRSH